MPSLLLETADITELMHADSREPVAAAALVGGDRVEVLRLYRALHVARRTGQGQVLCRRCEVPVYLCAMPDRQHFYFRHYHEDGSCPAITRGALSEDEINALRYHGQREGKRHIRLKHLVAESIGADPDFTAPIIEGTWKGVDGREFRRPDVRARWRDTVEVAFEVQLSTTYGRVMAEREVFYRSQGGLLLWVFGSFEFDQARLMMEVIFANNNRNAFVVSEASREASEGAGALILECCWEQPSIHDGGIIWTPHRKLVRFDELTIDQARQRVFYVDTDAEASRLERELHGPTPTEEFDAFWLAYEGVDGREPPAPAECDRAWASLESTFETYNAWLPPRRDWAFRDALRVLYLAKLGRAVGWRYASLWPAAHHVFDAHKPLLWIFLPALERYGRLQEIEAADRRGAWAAKLYDWRQGVAAGDAAYAPDHRYDEPLRLVFPELWDAFDAHDQA